MSYFKTLTTITVTVLIAAPAFAQDTAHDTENDWPAEMATDTLTGDFTAADLDQNESLNPDEFVTFAVMRAEGGDEGFKDIVLGGEYNVMFKTYDADASGVIEISELAAPDAPLTDSDLMDLDLKEPESEDVAEPDLN